MHRIAISLIMLIIISGLAMPQKRTPRKSNRQSEPRSSPKLARPRTTVGLDFRGLTLDRMGGVWIAGSAWQLRGLMINDRNGQTKAITIPGVWAVSESHFVTPDIGWMSDRHSLYRTLDGGNSWQELRTLKGAEVRTVYFSDVQNGWAGGWNGEIYRTTNGGQTWSKGQIGLNYEIQQIFFLDALNGWATAFKFFSNLRRMAALLRTTDGGQTWEILSNEGADSPRSVHSLFFVGGNEGWAIDRWQHNIVHTVDGGRTWTIQLRRRDRGWNSLFFINDREGWAAGDDGIVHTSNGGETWNHQIELRQWQIYIERIVFADNKHGWIVGPERALRTTDGGITWRPISDDWKTQIPTYQMLRESSSKAKGKDRSLAKEEIAKSQETKR